MKIARARTLKETYWRISCNILVVLGLHSIVFRHNYPFDIYITGGNYRRMSCLTDSSFILRLAFTCVFTTAWAVFTPRHRTLWHPRVPTFHYAPRHHSIAKKALLALRMWDRKVWEPESGLVKRRCVNGNSLVGVFQQSAFVRVFGKVMLIGTNYPEMGHQWIDSEEAGWGVLLPVFKSIQ